MTRLATSDMTYEERLRRHGWTETNRGHATSCWKFEGPRDRAGYGQLKIAGRSVKAHRVAYETWVGPIPEGMLVRHRVCSWPSCINPAHLEVGTHQDNMDDKVRDGRAPSGDAHWTRRNTPIGVS